MRNKYPGTCYRCGQRVEAGEGHFERKNGMWKVQHAACAIKYRGTNQDYRNAVNDFSKKKMNGDETMNETNENGELKWSCDNCGHVWYDSFFVTYVECPQCESEDMGHH